MKILNTPAEQFIDLPDYPFKANFQEIDGGLNIHYVDEGPKDGQIVLLLHGEPSWSYLYRKMIPTIANAGYRAIAPDLIGFGKSDKLVEVEAYTYQSHQQWLQSFIEALDLQNMVLFSQDWGGLLGLRIALDLPERFAALVAANTFLPTGAIEMPPAFLQWREFVRTSKDFDTGKVIDMGTVTKLSPEVIAAYNAPFPNEDYKLAARIFPSLVPSESDDPEGQKNVAYLQKLAQWTKPFLTLFSDSDPIMKGGERFFQKVVPGANGQAHEIIKDGGHFLQEDQGEIIAEKLVNFISKL